MRYIKFSEIGPRQNNEDCCSIVECPSKRTLFVVCDGMGGHFGGEIASRTVCDAFMIYWQEHDGFDSCQKVIGASKAASDALDEKSGLSEMGTTLVMASVEGDQVTIAHSGDSRCYVIDHSGRQRVGRFRDCSCKLCTGTSEDLVQRHPQGPTRASSVMCVS